MFARIARLASPSLSLVPSVAVGFASVAVDGLLKPPNAGRATVDSSQSSFLPAVGYPVCIG